MSPTRPSGRSRGTRASTGDEQLDALVEGLLDAAGPNDDRDVINEMLVSVMRLARAGYDRGDMKIVNTTLRELRNSFAVFEPHRSARKASVFGSARTPSNAPAYIAAREVGEALAAMGWMVITGGGPGIMTAAVEGAGRDESFAVTIRLPFEPTTGASIVANDHLVRFRYFFTRKLTFMKESSAYVCMPGGFGTLDETFELLTLLQTGKEPPAPVVLFDPPGERYWAEWLEFVKRQLQSTGLVSSDDLDLVTLTSSVPEACAAISLFYRTYHSQRYVDGHLVLRLNHEISDGHLESLNREFADIVVAGRIERTEALPIEVADRDHVHLPRLILDFDNRHFARLIALIRRLGSD